MWTRFMDMHSGGGQKEKWPYIIIEASEREARVIFYNRFGHNPERVTCTCCGEDYSISEAESLEQITAHDRGCAYAYFDQGGNEVPEKEAFVSGKGMKPGYVGRYIERGDAEYKAYRTLDAYLTSGECLVIRANEIKPEERTGDVPEEGYVWVD